MHDHNVAAATRTSVNWTALIESALLGGVGVMMLWKAHAGVLDYYIHPRYTWLVVAAGSLLMLVMMMQLRVGFEPSIQRPRFQARHVILAIPLLVGLAIPDRPLPSAALINTSLGDSALVGSTQQLPLDSRDWNVLEWSTAVNLRLSSTIGRPVDVIGFVSHGPEHPSVGFYVSRFVVTCCVADSAGVRLPVAWPEGAVLPEDSWVRVQGTLDTLVQGNTIAPIINATLVERIEQPDPPYLYAYR